MAKARYVVHVPNQHRNVAIAGHHYLTSGPVRGIHSATVQFGHPHDSLAVYGEESPELDSHIKQTGVFMADVANLPYINAMKHGKNVAHWPLYNPNYQELPPGDIAGAGTLPMAPAPA